MLSGGEGESTSGGGRRSLAFARAVRTPRCRIRAAENQIPIAAGQPNVAKENSHSQSFGWSMTIPIGPLSVVISAKDGDRYKSISSLIWNDVPGFAILTGKNGSGKTQLLEVLAFHFSGAMLPVGKPLPLSVRTEGTQYQPDELGYLPSGGRFSGGGGTSIANLSQARQQIHQLAQNPNNYRNDINQWVRSQRARKLLAGADLLKDDLEFTLDDLDVTQGLCYVFVAHRFKLLEALERRTPGIDETGRSLAPAPWDVVNESLQAAGFAYQVIPPTETRIIEHYSLHLRDRSVPDRIIPAIDLSSGEKVILQLVLWLFTAGKEGIFPKLLILDEPDAHLHPSMTQQFLDVISDVLVNKYGVRVIISTHSPSTVALAPEGSVFKLERDASSVLPVTSRAEIISTLTAGLVTVSKASKFCFVEDDDDVSFYDTVRDILSDAGPSRDPMALASAPSIAFVPASIGSGPVKVGGGSSVVAKWVNKLDADPLLHTFVGIIDLDQSNVADPRVKVIGRYSIENYLLDPLVIFALLSEDGRAPVVPGVAITSGDEHLLRIKDSRTLQAIADVICSELEAAEPSLSCFPKIAIAYTAGQVIQVSDWIVSHRGHDLLPKMQRTFGGHGLVNQVRLRKAMRRCRLIPVELAVLLREIQQY
jgi:energy-coupling factor transporter ATP-binding protein EcfA2